VSEAITIGLDRLVRDGLCAGCGLCEGLAEPGQIEMALNADGFLRPQVRSTLDPAIEARIESLCPGLRMDAFDDGAPIGGEVDLIWGRVVRAGRCHAGDDRLRFEGSSAGVLTALATWLLESGQVDVIRHVAADPARPMHSRSHESRSAADVRSAMGARYGPVPPMNDFGDFIARLPAGQTYAFIGNPCQVAAARNLGRIDDRIERACAAWITFACDGIPSMSKSTDVLESWGVPEGDLTEYTYRGYGNPGLHRAVTRDGRTHQKPAMEVWDDPNDWRLQYRCQICPDATAEGADIVVADAWIGGIPTGEHESHNTLIARTPRGAALVGGAERDGDVVFDREWGPRDLDAVHPLHVRLKRSLSDRYAALRAEGRYTPTGEGLRLTEIAEKVPTDDRARTADEMARRARRGEGREALIEVVLLGEVAEAGLDGHWVGFAADGYAAFVGGEELAYHAKEGALAGAVGADKAKDASRGDLQIDPVHGNKVPEALHHPLNGDHGTTPVTHCKPHR